MRVPAPRGVYCLPSLEISKAARQSSGPEPLRFQVMVVPLESLAKGSEKPSSHSEAPDEMPHLTPQLPKLSPHYDLPIRLYRQVGDIGISPRGIGPRVEVRVQRAVGLEPSEVIPRLPPQRGESSPHDDLAIRLYRQSSNIVAGSRVEGRVQRTVGIDPPDALSQLPPSLVNEPPTMIRPSVCTARVFTWLSVPGSKAASGVPLAFSRPR